MKNSKLKTHNSKLIDIDHVAKLAMLKLTDQEKKTFAPQLEEVISYISKLAEVETQNVEPIGHITGQENITREDIAEPSLSQDDALGNAPKTHNGFFEVDAIFDND